ncbi:UNVERIFIED_CONTAM: hypothetical protein Sindi_1483000 [Sesamum indicum]
MNSDFCLPKHNIKYTTLILALTPPWISSRNFLRRLNIRNEDRHDVYHHLPAATGQSKKEVFSSISDRVWRRIQGRHEKSLSQAGREVLIKVVIQAIPAYTMSCFRLPDSLLHEMEMMAANFWWNKESKKIYMVVLSKTMQRKVGASVSESQMLQYCHAF